MRSRSSRFATVVPPGDVYRELDDVASAAQAYRRALGAADLYGRPFTDSVATRLDWPEDDRAAPLSNPTMEDS